MRPLFAIAPLAALFALLGPASPEANQTLAHIKAYFFSAQPQDPAAPERRTSGTKPALLHSAPAFTAAQAGPAFKTELRP